MSFVKCSYCEVKLQEDGKYMEVEHIKPKSVHPDLVLYWENLLPACKTCNGNKGEEDIAFINPTTDEIKEHIALLSFRFRKKTQKGQNTIEASDLNRMTKTNSLLKNISSRFEVGQNFIKKIEVCNNQNKQVNKRNEFKTILTEAQPEAEFAATVATVLFNPSYGVSDLVQNIASELKKNGYWTDEIDFLYHNSKTLAFTDELKDLKNIQP